jgi:hypothetical protein
MIACLVLMIGFDIGYNDHRGGHVSDSIRRGNIKVSSVEHSYFPIFHEYNQSLNL